MAPLKGLLEYGSKGRGVPSESRTLDPKRYKRKGSEGGKAERRYCRVAGEMHRAGEGNGKIDWPYSLIRCYQGR